MCGIVAYIGAKDAYPIIIKGLKRLEYRGYDSAGIALSTHGQLNIYKKQGKVSNLEAYAADKNCSGASGIGHTRWATHGEPNDVNAHSHALQTAQQSRRNRTRGAGGPDRDVTATPVVSGATPRGRASDPYRRPH